MAAGENNGGAILEWSVENWVTVVLMAAIAFAGFGAIQAWYQKRQGAAA